MKTRGRYLILTLCLSAFIGGLIYRMVSLHVFEQQFLRSQGDARTLRSVAVPPYRGMIKDRYGEALAVSTAVDSLWVNPREFNIEHPQLLALAGALDISLEALIDKVQKFPNKEFVYLQRHISPVLAETIKKLAMPGVHFKSEYRRYYPAGEVSAHVLGFTDIDDHGLEGLELSYDTALKGEAGSKRIIQDRLGREVEVVESTSTKPGQDLILSLDQRLQYLAYRELKLAVDAHEAIGGSAIVLDVRTGEVLAMVNQPSFNPNQRVNLRADGRCRNRAVTDSFEPGSAMKTFSVVSALQRGGVTPGTLVDTSPGWIKVGGHIVKETDNKNYGLIDIATILQKSSNVGVSKITLLSPSSHLLETYQSLGFGSSTNSGFPGENAGVLRSPPKQASFVLTTMAFGYGLSVTPLQLARAYAILGAGGVKRPVTFLKQSKLPPGERVIDPEIAQQVLHMLKLAVERGGSKAQVVGYQTAGKTGTARKVSSLGGYHEDSHVAIFAGLAPASHPRFAIVVMVDDPKGALYYGSQVAAPVFSKIASGALRLYNIPPDVTDKEKLHVAKFRDEGASINE